MVLLHLGTFNPVRLARVILLIDQDSALLLGHTNAPVRDFLIGTGGKLVATSMMAAWLLIPCRLSYRMFTKRYF